MVMVSLYGEHYRLEKRSGTPTGKSTVRAVKLPDDLPLSTSAVELALAIFDDADRWSAAKITGERSPRTTVPNEGIAASLYLREELS